LRPASARFVASVLIGEINRLEAALADPGLQAQPAAIGESLDAEPPIAPPRKPTVPLGAAPSIKMSQPRPAPPKAPRRVTGPDAEDRLIPF